MAAGARREVQGFRVYVAQREGSLSLRRACALLTLDPDCVRLVPTEADFRMDVAALARMMDEDRARGAVPFCVVASVGSPYVGAVDPLDAVADVCAARDVWLHADGTLGAMGALLPELAHLYRGLDRADSVSLDLRVWLGTSSAGEALLVKDPHRLVRSWATPASDEDAAGRAAHVWTGLREYGPEGRCTHLRQSIACAHHAYLWTHMHPDFQAAHQPELALFCFRYAPVALQNATLRSPEVREDAEVYLDWLNQRIAQELPDAGEATVTSVTLGDRVMLFLTVQSERTRQEDVECLMESIERVGSSLMGPRAARSSAA